MKRKDIALIGIVVFISVIISLVLSKVLISPSKNHSEKAEVVQPISSEFVTPDTAYFNKDSFDPTQTITIGQSTNPDPFSGTTTGTTQ